MHKGFPINRQVLVNGRIKGAQSKKYLKTRIKLQASYQRAQNIQTDLMHKFTTELVNIMNLRLARIGGNLVRKSKNSLRYELRKTALAI